VLRFSCVLLVLGAACPTRAQTIIQCGKAFTQAKAKPTTTNLKACIKHCTGVPRPENLKWCAQTKRAKARAARPPNPKPPYTFKKAEVVFRHFDRLKIGGSHRKLARDVKVLTEQMKRLQTMYEAVLQSGQGEHKWAALYRLSQIHERFAEKLENSPVPSTLNAEEAEVYRSILGTKIRPLRDRAVEYYAMLLQKSQALGVTNEWTRAAEAAHQRLTGKAARPPQ
jgi:hypothetical protein